MIFYRPCDCLRIIDFLKRVLLSDNLMRMTHLLNNLFTTSDKKKLFDDFLQSKIPNKFINAVFVNLRTYMPFCLWQCPEFVLTI